MTLGGPLTDLLNLPGQPVDPLGEQILDAALARFIEYGIRRTKIEDIAQAAGLNRVTIYRRFTDRSGLIKATIAREAIRTMAAVTAAVTDIGDPQDRLVEAFVIGARLVRNHPLLDRLLRSEPEEIAIHLTINGAPVITAMRTIITQQYRPT
ncbi:MAG TPA: helix-turn-helix domain-containing protein, partial [Pseudonocardia sp.]